jgi:hypothetical protein
MRAFNAAAKDRYEKAGFKMKWLTARDPQVCEICEPLDGQIVEIVPPIHPNCFSEDTEILTIDGFKLFKDIQKHEFVATLNSHTFELEYCPVEKTIKYQYKGTMMHYKTRSLDILMTPDHQVPYISKWTKKLQWKNANEIAVSDMLIRNCKWSGADFSITIGDLKFTSEQFVKFMAWWLSDGSVTKRSKNSYQIKIAQEENMQELLEDLKDFPTKIDIAKNGIYIFHTELGKYLTKFGKSWEKYIPSIIKGAPTQILKTFLETYRKADGHTRKAKQWKGGKFKDEHSYFTSSKRLADDLSEIIIKSGNHPSIKLGNVYKVYDKKQNKFYLIKHPAYVIRECRSKYTHIKKQYITKENYEHPVYCIDVPPHHIILIRRNGKIVWMGNCRCTIVPVLEKP